MRRLSRRTAPSMILGGLALTLFTFFVLSGSFLFIILAFILLFISGFTRKRESYDDYRKRYDERYGVNDEEQESP